MHQPPCYLLTNTSEEKCVSLNIYLLLHLFCLCIYISHTQTELLIAFSFHSLYFQWIIKTHYSSHTSFLLLLLFIVTSVCVWLWESLEKRAIFINYPIKCMYYIVPVHYMVVNSLSAFPLKILLSEVYNYSVKLASSTIKFQLEEKGSTFSKNWV